MKKNALISLHRKRNFEALIKLEEFYDIYATEGTAKDGEIVETVKDYSTGKEEVKRSLKLNSKEILGDYHVEYSKFYYMLKDGSSLGFTGTDRIIDLIVLDLAENGDIGGFGILKHALYDSKVPVVVSAEDYGKLTSNLNNLDSIAINLNEKAVKYYLDYENKINRYVARRRGVKI